YEGHIGAFHEAGGDPGESQGLSDLGLDGVSLHFVAVPPYVVDRRSSGFELVGLAQNLVHDWEASILPRCDDFLSHSGDIAVGGCRCRDAKVHHLIETMLAFGLILAPRPQAVVDFLPPGPHGPRSLCLKQGIVRGTDPLPYSGEL